MGLEHSRRELPPRTRRIRPCGVRRPPENGTTSAYAENTASPHPQSSQPWNYLRVRGEYRGPQVLLLEHEELPPRTRRIQIHHQGTQMRLGTTSAYAENTAKDDDRVRAFGNYLRVRGEYGGGVSSTGVPWELPPRTRRILIAHTLLLFLVGTTSAYAENTPSAGADQVQAGNYLRVRGEYLL